jgi:anthranilate synthase component 1
VVVPRAAAVLEGASALDQVRAAVRDRVADVGIDLPRFVGGAVGMLGHEFVTTVEPRVGRAPGAPAVDLPDARFLLVDELVAFDHRAGRVLAICTIDADHAPDLQRAYDRALGRIAGIEQRLVAAARASAVPVAVREEQAVVTANVDDASFEAMVREAREQVLAGECVQVVLSRRFDVHASIDPLVAYRSMRAVSPAPYHALLRLGDASIVGASPEQLVGVAGDERVVTHPIAGTRPRGASPDEDLALERELLADPKERAEHMMLVDLGRNDVARVAEPGSVRVERLCEVERFSHVMHLVSRVEGTLREGLHPVDALRAAFPAGTLTGAPKVRAMELIAELEPDRRGAYGGVVGYVGHGRTTDMAITIRTAVIDEAAGIASVQAGAGIVAASDPAAEAAETRHKARGMLAALVAAAGSGTRAPSAAELVGGAA